MDPTTLGTHGLLLILAVYLLTLFAKERLWAWLFQRKPTAWELRLLALGVGGALAPLLGVSGSGWVDPVIGVVLGGGVTAANALSQGHLKDKRDPPEEKRE